MKNFFFSTLSIFIFCFSAWGQCPPSNDIIFTSQQEVDNFAINYPNCQALTTVRIGEYATPSDINDLSPLSSLLFVGAVLYIQNNPMLTSLEGLDNIFHIEGDLNIINNSNLIDITALSGLTFLKILEIEDNSQLTSLNGLDNLSDNLIRLRVGNNAALTSLGDFGNITNLLTLDINSNSALTNLSGLESITQVGGLNLTDNSMLNSLDGLVNLGSVGSATISRNQSLTTLSGLENLSSTGNMGIVNNASLSDISALSNTYLGTYLSIANNPVLSVCNIPSVCNHLGNGRNAYINHNAGDCVYAELVYANCGFTYPICPLNQDILFTTQGDVDSFAVRFPSCTSLNSLWIESGFSQPRINDLSPLQKIETINEDLVIANTDIVDLQGFENLTSVSGLRIYTNGILTNLNALENLNSVGGGLYISSNEILSSLNGLGNINPYLLSFLFIKDNINLSVCYVEGVCNYLQNGGDNGIEDNAPGCNSEEEIEASCIALPVELIRFTAEAERGNVLLTWQTASETNNQGFEIQRSKDGINWEKIGYQQGAGNSTTRQDYRYNDIQPLSGINYYRLKQIDVEGDFIYSDVVSVLYRNRGFSVFPVPAKDEITLQLESLQTAVQIRISNIVGEVIHTQDLQLSEGVNQFTLDISEYANGIYFLTINNGDKNGTQRFVKQ